MQFKVSPIVPEAGVRQWKKENTRRRFEGGDELHLERGQCHGGDAAFVCKTTEVPRRCLPSTYSTPLFNFFNRRRNRERFALHAALCS